MTMMNRVTVAAFVLLCLTGAVPLAQTPDDDPGTPAGASVLQVQGRARPDHPRQHAHPAHHRDSDPAERDHSRFHCRRLRVLAPDRRPRISPF